MAQYKHFEFDFIERTLEIIESYRGEYDVTLLVNCCVGLLMLPREKFNIPFFTELSYCDGELIFGLSERNIVLIDDHYNNRKRKQYSINNVLRHMRNAIAHSHIKQEIGFNGEIASLRFEDYQGNDKSFEAIMTIDRFREFCISIAKEVLKSKPGS